jgi:hypothetical protein
MLGSEGRGANMASRRASSERGVGVLTFIEQVGRAVELALAVLMLPVGRAVLWLGRTVQRLFSALRRS